MRNYKEYFKIFVITFSVLIVIYLPSFYQSCGMLTHQEISRRAYEKFTPNSNNPENNNTTATDYKLILTKHSSFLQAGSPFPDWGYTCKQGDAGEATHWPPFIHSFTDYVKNYSSDPVQKEKLIAFLFGMESHSISDISWHWGRSTTGTTDQGYLQSMSHLASYCNDKWNEGKDPSCHSIGDTGADFYLAYRKTDTWMSNFWAVPSKDLSNVYKNVGFTITEKEINLCLLKMYVGSQLERLVTGLALFFFEQKAAFLTEDLDLWYVGGIDDMAINVIWKWHTLIDLLENKQENIIENFSKHIKTSNSKHLIIKAIENNYHDIVDMIEAKIKKDDFGNTIFTHNDYKLNLSQSLISELVLNILIPDKFELNLLKANYEKRLFSQTVKNGLLLLSSKFLGSPKPSKISSQFKVKGKVSYGYFGESMAFGDFNNDGIEELAVGVPGYGLYQQGGVYILNPSKFYASKVGLKDIPDIVGLDYYSRFGYQLVTIDFNHDGIDDLAVSAPTFGTNGDRTPLENYYPKSNYGRVYIYFGNKNGLNYSKPDVEILSDLTKFEGIFDNLGSVLSSGDCNNDGFQDLLIGAPYAAEGGDKRGFFAVYLGGNSYEGQIYLQKTADFIDSGKNDFEEFGKSLSCGNGIILVGAPGSRPSNQNQNDDIIQSAGAVFGYQISKDVPYQFNLNFSIICDSPQSNFGDSVGIDLSNGNIIVGAPSYTQKKTNYAKLPNIDLSDHNQGIVLIYNTNDVLNKLENNYITSSKSRINGETNRARFGKSINFLNNNLFVGSPMFSTLIFNDKGEVTIFENYSNFSGEVMKTKISTETLSGDSENSERFGNTVIVSKKRNIFAISSHFEGNKLEGEITVYSLSK